MVGRKHTLNADRQRLFHFQVLAVLGILPSTRHMPIYQLLVSFGALVASLAYLIGLAVSIERVLAPNHGAVL